MKNLVNQMGRELKESINKEFIPVFYIILSPMLSFMNGYGIRTYTFSVDVYFILPVLFGIYMCKSERIRIPCPGIPLFLFALNILMTTPFFDTKSIYSMDFTQLILSYSAVVVFFIMVSVSFFINNPYFVSFYRTDKETYRTIYRMIGVFFTCVAVYHVVLFYKIIEILKMTMG